MIYILKTLPQTIDIIDEHVSLYNMYLVSKNNKKNYAQACLHLEDYFMRSSDVRALIKHLINAEIPVEIHTLKTEIIEARLGYMSNIFTNLNLDKNKIGNMDWDYQNEMYCLNQLNQVIGV